MNPLSLRKNSTLLLATAISFLTMAGHQLFAGVSGPAGDGGLQIVFSDDGAGGTLITASGTGITDDDGGFSAPGLGFSSVILMPTSGNPKAFGKEPVEKLIPMISDADLIDFTPPGTPPYPILDAVPLSDPITLNLSTFGPLVIDAFFSNASDFGFQLGMFVDPVMGTSETLTAPDGNGRMPVDYSTFAAFYGKTLASTDGFTFVFTAPATGQGRPDLLIGKNSSRLKGDNVYDKKKPSNKQRLIVSRNIFTTNTAKATLQLQNDGATAGTFGLKSSGDKQPRMKVSAKLVGGGNVSAAIKSGRFSQTLAPGASATVKYSLRTNRFYAGVLRGGDRNDSVKFRMSGGGHKDNCELLIKYVLPTGPPQL